MVFYLIICRSLTYAQRTAKTLERAGITAILTKTPQNISVEGCGYCVKVSEKRLADALVALKNEELTPRRIFVLFSDGHYSEVPV